MEKVEQTNITMSENSESSIVAVASGLGATAASLGTITVSIPLPDEVKAVVALAAGVLGAVSVGLFSFWKAKINKIQPQ